MSKKIHIEKRATLCLDTSFERKRIEKAFSGDKVTKAKLNELMDAVEACEWKRAMELVSDEWWSGRDARQECPRLEFIGLLFGAKNPAPEGFSHNASYLDLILSFNDNPEIYKVLEVES